jgi:Uncharacterized protein conserved in bacteria (DUF2147)
MCLTVIQGLQPAGLDHWNSGSLCNPDDGATNRVSAEPRSADRFVARIYLGVPLFGETKTLLRVPRLRPAGWRQGRLGGRLDVRSGHINPLL